MLLGVDVSSFTGETPALGGPSPARIWPPSACSIIQGPRWCWSAPGWRRNGPARHHRPRRAGQARKRRSKSLAEPDCRPYSAWWCCWLALGHVCVLVAVEAPGCCPRCWPPRPQGMRHGRACRARGGARDAFSLALQWRLRARWVALPCALAWPRPTHHRGSGPGGLAPACCSAVADAIEIASRLQTVLFTKPATLTQAAGGIAVSFGGGSGSGMRAGRKA